MANQLHLDILLQGVEVWNRWREQNPGISPDLSRADLKGMVLPGVNLAGVNLQGANLRETIFEDANFLGADLRGVNLQQAELRKADLSEANLNRANLRQADLRDANLVEASMAGVELGQAKLQGVMLSKKGPRRAKPGLGGRSQTPPPRRSSTAPVPAKRRKKAALGSVVRPAAKRRRLLFLVLGPSIVVIVIAGLAFLATPQPVRREQVRKTSEQARAASISEVEATLTEALTAGWELQSITTEDGIMSIRLDVESIPPDEYYAMMTAACRAIDPLGDTPTSLREMKFLPAPGRQGWVYTAPRNCRQIVRTPANLVRLRIAANTTSF